MKGPLTILTLATLEVATFIGVASAAPSPALAGGGTRISGLAYFDEPDTCDSASMGADFALLMTGDLDGCLYTFVDTVQRTLSGTYRETGTELCVDLGEPARSK